MNPSQFWLRATDIHRLYHGRFKYARRTDDGLLDRVTDYIQDIMPLMGEWYNTEHGTKQEDKIVDKQTSTSKD
jgi:hypothetical protein